MVPKDGSGLPNRRRSRGSRGSMTVIGSTPLSVSAKFLERLECDAWNPVRASSLSAETLNPSMSKIPYPMLPIPVMIGDKSPWLRNTT